MPRILLVDHNTQRAAGLHDRLRRQGHSTLSARDSRELLMLAPGEHVEAVVLGADGPVTRGTKEMVATLTAAGALLFVMEDPRSRLPIAENADLVMNGDQDIDKMVHRIDAALQVANTAHSPVRPKRALVAPARTATSPPFPVLAISASTGGPQLISGILARTTLSDRFCYIVVLHGPAWMLTRYAERLDKSLLIRVKVAEHGETARAGTMYVAPGDHHLAVVADPTPKLQLLTTPKVNFVRPAIDVTFRSVAEVFGGHSIGVVLTGLGKDGAAGCADIADQGGTVIVQSPDTAVAPSMPMATLRSVPTALSIGPPDLPAALALHMSRVYKRGWLQREQLTG